MTESKDDDAINYELLVEDLLRTVVRSALALVAHEGLPGDAHFYISFNTSHPDVDISDSLECPQRRDDDCSATPILGSGCYRT